MKKLNGILFWRRRKVEVKHKNCCYNYSRFHRKFSPISNRDEKIIHISHTDEWK